MAPKTALARITDTLNYLQNTAPVLPAVRADVHQFVNAYLTGRFPLGAASPGYQALSDELSLGYHFFDDPNERRKMARALFLIWKAMNHRDNQFVLPKQNVGQISLGTVQAQLVNYMRKARCVWDAINGTHAGATQALADFQAAPLPFMTANKVYVRGSGHLNAPPTNVQPCFFYYQLARDRFVFFVNGFMNPGASNINVESVTAFHWTDARYVPPPALGQVHNVATANFGAITGIQLSGAHPMVTTQFTGCSFCMAEHMGAMYCAHVSPFVIGAQHNTDGTTLAARILLNGAIQNAGGNAPTVYGRNLGSPPHAAGYNIGGGGGATTYMTIVGFPGGGSYNIYAQTTENDQIQGVPVQIF